MSLTAIVLLVISAVMHAGWNLLSKWQQPSASFFLMTNVVGVVAFFPFLVIYRNKLRALLNFVKQHEGVRHGGFRDKFADKVDSFAQSSQLRIEN